MKAKIVPNPKKPPGNFYLCKSEITANLLAMPNNTHTHTHKKKEIKEITDFFSGPKCRDRSKGKRKALG